MISYSEYMSQGFEVICSSITILNELPLLFWVYFENVFMRIIMQSSSSRSHMC